MTLNATSFPTSRARRYSLAANEKGLENQYVMQRLGVIIPHPRGLMIRREEH